LYSLSILPMRFMNTKILPILVSLLLVPGLVFAQQGTLSGTVVDASSGETLPGASVQVPSTGSGTAADAQGQFTLRLEPGNYEVRVSFVGYQTQTRNVSITAGSTTSVRVQLEAREGELDEVVVTAQQQNRQER